MASCLCDSILLPLIITAISYSSSRHVALSSRALCSITGIICIHARSARFQPRGLTSSTALHHYNKAKLTRLKLTIRHQCLNLRIIPSVSFGDLQFASLVAARPKIWIRQISLSARIFFYMLMRDIEWCIFSAEKVNFVLDLNVLVLYVHTYIRTASHQIGSEGWDKRQAIRQANRQAFTAYPFPSQLGTCFDWARHAHTDPAVASLSICFLGGPIWAHHQECKSPSSFTGQITTKPYMYELFISPSVGGNRHRYTAIPLSDLITTIASTPSCSRLAQIQYILVTIIKHIPNSSLTFLFTCSTLFHPLLELWGIFFLAKIHPFLLLTLLIKK